LFELFVGTVTGIGAAALVAVLISNPIGIAIVVIGASFGGSAFYDYAISDTVKPTDC
jgi:NCAIR mutase (PurE)-related protein